MAKAMKTIAALTVIGTICCAVLYKLSNLFVFLTFAITFGTTAYHFCIRLLIGTLIPAMMQNGADDTKKWFQVRDWEQKLYTKLNVKAWKNKMPTYNPELFDISKHSWAEIVQATCVSELVHETNVAVSFVPLVFTVWFGSFAVFLLTSLAAVAVDLMFVMMQRYNRPRIQRIIRKSAKS